MKLWIVEQDEDNSERGDYDTYSEIVFRAETEDEARAMVMAGDPQWTHIKEPYEGFRDGRFTVKELTADGEPGLVIGSFHAG